MNNNSHDSSLDKDITWLAQTLRYVERLHHSIWVYDIDNSKIIWCNNSSLSLWKAESSQDLMSRDMSSNTSVTVIKRLNQYKSDWENNELLQFDEVWTFFPNGEPTTYDMVYSSIRLNTGRICMLCEATKRNATDSDALRSSEALLHTSVNISLYAATGEPLYRNPAARGNVCCADTTLQQLFSNEDLLEQLQTVEKAEINAVTGVNTINGVQWHDITARRCTDAVSGEPAWLISEVDVSRLKATEVHAQFLAEHDTLTKLPNRNYVSLYFQPRIDKLIAKKNTGAIIFIDLDKFKDVNDSLGHDAGDQLLIEIGNRLNDISTQPNSVARLGGDEFLLLLSPEQNEPQLNESVEQIIRVVSQPICLQGREVQVTPSIGIALFPSDGTNIQDLMRHADLAMYHAKDAGKNDFAYFTTELSDAVETRINLESEIRSGLENNEFVAWFQPRVDVKTGKIVSAEALARWNHPTQGLIAPYIFIPACEECGLIVELGKQIFTQSVIAQRQLAEQGHDIRMSVNLSPIQFTESNLIDDLTAIIEKENGNPHRIELEITESVLLGNDQATIDKLHALVEYGFEISIDDFGTGYSNLAYLHRYPIHCLKIDRSFIQSMDSAQPIIELVISMAKLFKLTVVAEGVEEPEQLNALQKYQNIEYQGFLFSKPIPYADFTSLIIDEDKKTA